MQIRCENCGSPVSISHNQKVAQCPKCHSSIRIDDQDHSVKKAFDTVEKAFGKKAAKKLDKKLKFD